MTASQLTIQFQPGRAPGLQISDLCVVCEELASDKASLVIDRSDPEYVNFMFEANDLRALWKLIKQRLYGDGAISDFLRQSSIVVCEGTRGWDDYKLLHHFDPAQQLDEIPGN